MPIKVRQNHIPKVTGQTFIIGFHQFVMDPRDPLQIGGMVRVVFCLENKGIEDEMVK